MKKQQKAPINRKGSREQPSLPIEEIHWHDASYNSGDVLSTERVKADGHYYLLNCGYLIAEDKEEIHIGAEYSPEGKNWRHIVHIPKRMIISRRKIR